MPVKHQFRKNVKDVRTLPAADIDSDHNLLIAKIHTKMQKNHEIPKVKTKVASGEITCSMKESARYS
jgi:hypothetical protein